MQATDGCTLVIDTSYGSTVGVVGHEPIVETDSRTHVEKLQVNIARAMDAAGLGPADLSCIVVGMFQRHLGEHRQAGRPRIQNGSLDHRAESIQALPCVGVSGRPVTDHVHDVSHAANLRATAYLGVDPLHDMAGVVDVHSDPMAGIRL